MRAQTWRTRWRWILIRGVTVALQIYEEFLQLIPLHCTITRHNIFNAVFQCMKQTPSTCPISCASRSSGPAHRYHYAHKWPQCEAARQKHSSQRHVFAHHRLRGKAALVRSSIGCWSVYVFSSYCGLYSWLRERERLCHLFAGGICLPFHRSTSSRFQAAHLPLHHPLHLHLASLQMRLVELQCNDELKAKYRTASPLSFFRAIFTVVNNSFQKWNI